MYVLAVLLFVGFVSAAAVPEPVYRIAVPDSPVQRIEATSGPVRVAGLPSDTNIIVSIALVTGAPVAEARVDDPDTVSSSACTPNSFCFDGITCGLRYGGCYDKKFCAGSTSFPIPSCTQDAAADLTQNMQKRAEAAAAARARAAAE